MEKKQTITPLKLLTLITFIAMITVNALANILPINGITTGDVSDSYGNLFAPAGITFAVWGVIYFLLALYMLYLFGLFTSDKSKVNIGLLRKTGLIFSVSSIANTAWIFSWHYDNIPLSMILMAVILLCLILIVQSIKKESLSPRERFFVKLPFSIYFGWITVATVANATVLLVSLGWNGLGISESVWTMLILIVAALIGSVTTIKNKDFAYGLVLIWAYAGILIKHTSSDGFAGRYPIVIAVIIVCIVLLAASIIYILIPENRGRKIPD